MQTWHLDKYINIVWSAGRGALRHNAALLLIGLLLSSTPAGSQDGFQGLLSDLDGLERSLQVPVNPAAPMVERLSALEMRLFGTRRPGSMVDRLNSLKSAAREMPNSGLSPGGNLQQAMPNSGLSAGGNLQQAIPNPNLYTPAARQSVWAPNARETGWAPNAIQNPNLGSMPAPGSAGFFPPSGTQEGPGASSWTPNSAPARDLSIGSPSSGAGAAGFGIGAGAATGAGVSPNSALALRKNFASDALPLLNAFPPTVVRMEPDNTALIARPDYYDAVLKASKGKTIRFKNMPIAVYVQPYPDRGFMNCVVRAFETWEFRTNGTVKFSQIENPNQARIQVVWKHLGGNKDSSGCLLGAHTILKYTNHGNGSLSVMSVGAVPLPIYIPRKGPKYTVPPQVMEVNLDLINTKEQSVKYACLQNIVTHELGHALGLLGHSQNQADIMYPVTDENSRLSQRDLNTLDKLYKQKCDLPL